MGCSPSKASKVRDPAPVIKSKSRTSTLTVIEEESENEELDQELSALLETSSSSSVSDLHDLTDEDDDISSFEFAHDDNTSTKKDTTTSINGEKEENSYTLLKKKTENEKEKGNAAKNKSKIASKQVQFTLPNKELNNKDWITYEGLSSSDGDAKIKPTVQPKRQTYTTSEDPSEFSANYPEVLHERQINWYNNDCYFDLDKEIQGYNLNKILYMFRDENTESGCSIM